MKLPYLAILRLGLAKTIAMLDCSIFNLPKFNISAKKKKKINARPKLSYLGIFGLELKKATALWYFTSAP